MRWTALTTSLAYFLLSFLKTTAMARPATYDDLLQSTLELSLRERDEEPLLPPIKYNQFFLQADIDKVPNTGSILDKQITGLSAAITVPNDDSGFQGFWHIINLEDNTTHTPVLPHVHDNPYYKDVPLYPLPPEWGNLANGKPALIFSTLR